jgi:hypothetical protein
MPSPQLPEATGASPRETLRHAQWLARSAETPDAAGLDRLPALELSTTAPDRGTRDPGRPRNRRCPTQPQASDSVAAHRPIPGSSGVDRRASSDRAMGFGKVCLGGEDIEPDDVHAGRGMGETDGHISSWGRRRDRYYRLDPL